MFASREAAGRELGHKLAQLGVRADLVLGLARGGVVVAAEVAHALRLPLDVLVVRKIGHPLQREFAIGAIAEHDVVVMDERRRWEKAENQVQAIIEEEKARLRRYASTFHQHSPPALANQSVILVDDGLATGATTEAAVLSVRTQKPKKVLVVAPVSSRNALDRLAKVADEVFALAVDVDFVAVGQYYASFPQTTDREVIDLLNTG